MFILCNYGFKILILFWVYDLSDVQASSVSVQTGECKYSPKYFNNFTMSVTNNTVNLDMDTIKPFDRGFKVHVDVSISLGKTKHYQRVFAHTIDTCGVVSAVKSNIFKAWFQSMLEHGNFMVNCPVMAGHYFLHNWKLNPNLVPQYLYAGDYRVIGHFFYGKLKSKQEEFVLDLIIFGILKTN